jgi:hypothetical protein
MNQTIIKTKLLDNDKHVEVRSYQLNKKDLRLIYCKDKDYNHHDHIGEDYMILPLSKHSKGIVLNTQVSKFYPYKNYLIYRFVWKSKGKIESEVLVDKKWEFKDGKAIMI